MFRDRGVVFRIQANRDIYVSFLVGDIALTDPNSDASLPRYALFNACFNRSFKLTDASLPSFQD